MSKTLRLVLGSIFGFISLASLVFFLCLIFSLDIIPTNYLVIGGVVILIVYILLFIGLFKKYRNLPLRIISYVFSIVVSIVLVVVGIVYFQNTRQFLSSIPVDDQETITFSVVALKSNNYEDIDDVQHEKIGFIKDDNTSQAEQTLENTIEFEPVENANAHQLSNLLFAGDVKAIAIEQGYVNLLGEVVENFEPDTVVIFTFEIKVDSVESTANIDPIEEPFILYVSGIDQYGNVESSRGRSDVNQLIVVNPKTHQILIVNTPRDYYVQLAGTTGLKDKLTHAGVYGIDKSMATLNELYGINIDYYIRINFDSLINLVDLIGGIDVYSDTDFIPLNDKRTHIVVGMNHFDGKAALGYARERYAYESGDRHRGANQQQVIEAIFSKVFTSESMLSNYGQIMGVLSGSFQTDIPQKFITDFIKMQLNDMPKWNISTYSVDGSGAMLPTYSMGENLPLYVMIPDEGTLSTARQKIENVLNGV